MGKHGPCYHCGVTSTPLWRNGPPDKPVLCNACGSRWRTKGTLANYTPLHMREALELEAPKRPKEKSTPLKLKVKSLQRGQWSNRIAEAESRTGEYGQSFLKGVDEDMSNRSSSGSAVSFSESCAHFSSADVSEVTGSFQSNAWEAVVPSRKRTGVVRPKQTAVEKLTMDLHSILHEQSSYLTVSSEEDLLYESNTPTDFIEIGNGSMLIRHPNSATIEEESEASSLPVRNITACSGLPFMMDTQSKGSGVTNTSNMKIRTSPTQEQSKRDKPSQEKFHILQNRESKLGFIDLEDIVCFEGYTKLLTNEEQQQLMKYLPSIDTAGPPESLESMFVSLEFVESLSCFQHLLQEGIFDLSTFEIKSDDCENLRKLILSNLTKGIWVESFKSHKDAAYHAKARKKGFQGEMTFFGHLSTTSQKRPREGRNDNPAESKIIMKSPKKQCKTVHPSLPSAKSIEKNPSELEKESNIKSSYCTYSNGSSIIPKSPYAPASQKSCIFDSLELMASVPDEDMLLDVRSSTSFPEAELLPHAWLPKAPAERFFAESGVSRKEGNLLYPSAVRFTGDLPKQW